MQVGNAVLNESQAGVIYAQTAELHDSRTSILVAQQVHADTIRTTVLLAGRVEGPVETMVDTPRALLAGLSAGVAVGLVLFVMRLITGRKS